MKEGGKGREDHKKEGHTKGHKMQEVKLRAPNALEKTLCGKQMTPVVLKN